MAVAKVYVGDELVGLIDVDAKVKITAQNLANAWPNEKTVLCIGKDREVIKPGQVAQLVKPHAEATTIVSRKPTLTRSPR